MGLVEIMESAEGHWRMTGEVGRQSIGDVSKAGEMIDGIG